MRWFARGKPFPSEANELLTVYERVPRLHAAKPSLCWDRWRRKVNDPAPGAAIVVVLAAGMYLVASVLPLLRN